MAHCFNRVNRNVVFVTALFGLLTLASCLPVPLGDPDKSKVDSKLNGFWIDVDDANSGNMYVIAPFDSHCYVVQAVAYTKKDDHYETKSSAWRAWITELKGSRFMTLQPIAHLADPAFPNDKYYPTAKIVLESGKLIYKGLEPNYSKFKDLKDSAQLAQIIQENREDSKMYVEKESTLRRMNASVESDAILMKLAMP